MVELTQHIHSGNQNDLYNILFDVINSEKIEYALDLCKKSYSNKWKKDKNIVLKRAGFPDKPNKQYFKKTSEFIAEALKAQKKILIVDKNNYNDVYRVLVEYYKTYKNMDELDAKTKVSSFFVADKIPVAG